MPCLCFQEQSSQTGYYKQTVNLNCVSLTIPIEIMLCVPQKNESQLISMLWRFREQIIKKIVSKVAQDINPNLTALHYVGASALESIVIKTGKDYNDNNTFMCSAISVFYNMEFVI